MGVPYMDDIHHWGNKYVEFIMKHMGTRQCLSESNTKLNFFKTRTCRRNSTATAALLGADTAAICYEVSRSATYFKYSGFHYRVLKGVNRFHIHSVTTVSFSQITHHILSHLASLALRNQSMPLPAWGAGPCFGAINSEENPEDLWIVLSKIR